MSQRLTAPKMADLLGISVRQFYRLAEQGLPAIREGRRVTYDSAAVIQWRIDQAVERELRLAFDE